MFQNTDEMDGRASIKRGDSVSRRTSNSAEIGKPNTSRFDRPRSGEEDEPMNISNFRAITLNVSTFFKQVRMILLIIFVRIVAVNLLIF